MKLISPRASTEFGTTGRGQVYMMKSGPAGTIFKSTSNPLTFLRWLVGDEDAEQADRELRKAQVDRVYVCRCCHGDFFSGSGATIADEPFCTPCLEADNHWEFFRAMDLQDGFINHLVENRMRYL